MATERQIEANRRNAGLSSGPKTEAGKSKSRANASKHGLAGQSAELESDISPEFADRRAKWGDEFRPIGDSAHWALDRAVAASLRIERCERRFDKLMISDRERAKLAWDQDREVEAAEVFGRLKRNPVLAARQLRTTRAGVGLLIDAWLSLIEALEVGDWSEPQASKALDLLGVDPDLRSGRTMIHAFDDSGPVPFRRELAFEEIERLESLRDEAMVPLDEMDRRHSLAGEGDLSAKATKLVLRYERDAWRRYREAIREVRSIEPAPLPSPVVAPLNPTDAPPPAVDGRAEARKRALTLEDAAFEEERRAVLAMAEPFRLIVTDRLTEMGFVDEDAWLDELERRFEAMPTPPSRGHAVPMAEGVMTSAARVVPGSTRTLVTERTQLGEGSTARAGTYPGMPS